MEYVVRVEDYWLAPWSGDPGRTLVKESATRYCNEHAARCAISYHTRVNKHRNMSNAVIEPYETEKRYA